jgi:hypothetical protein
MAQVMVILAEQTVPVMVEMDMQLVEELVMLKVHWSFTRCCRR